MTTIFQLMLFSCVRLHSLDGELSQMSCTWQGSEYFMTEAVCAAEGDAMVGRPLMGFMADSRKVEKTRCATIYVKGALP